MTEPIVEELRRWSAELQGWEFIHIQYFGTPECTKRQEELNDWMVKAKLENVGRYYIDELNKFWIRVEDWIPDSEDTPAWQILSVIERMRELGWKYGCFFSDEQKLPAVYGAEFARGVSSPVVGNAYNENLLLTILKAAYAAWKEMGK